MFNSSGICFLEKQIEILFSKTEEYNNYKLKIKRIGHLFYQYQQKLNEKEKNKKGDIIYINQVDNNSDNDYIFNSIETAIYKILILIKKEFILIGTFSKTCSRQYQQLLLTHIFIGMNNFKGDIGTISKKLSEIENYNDNNFIHIKSFYNNKERLNMKESNDILEILIFENIFLKTLIVHYQNVFYQVFKKEDLNLKQTKLKNLYIVDLNNAKILLDMNKIQGIKRKHQNKKFYKYDKLFEEILYQSKTMYNNYIKEFNFRFSNADSDFRFVKFECTSTYPRLLFIIRFVPVLKGLAIIHVYCQKKLSRNNDNNIQMEQGINCKEVDFIFGSFIRGNRNFEFKYGAPKKLEYIEKFMEEFFLTGRSGLNIFRINNQNKKYKYVNYDIIKIINSFQITKNMGVEEIFQNYLNTLKQQYEKDSKAKKEKKQENDENNLNNSDDDSDDNKKIDKLFSLNKETFYKVLLNIKLEEKKPQPNKQNKSINIITDSLLNNNTNIEQNININNLVNINSERQNLIDGKAISFVENNDKIRETRFENVSKISEVKTREKLEIKIVNIPITRQEENKEATNDKISNYSKIDNEKNLNEILELISSNSKIIENKKVEENSKEIEPNLTHSYKNKNKNNKNKLPLIDKSQ